ncbi:MAG: radical SAM protein [Actinobacteria bacterium]|nr:radical SAM protein [Actinomycetota bacterium]
MNRIGVPRVQSLVSLRIIHRLRALERATRPEHPDLAAALARRWEELPESVRTPNQMLGRRIAGCEGTQGVFPACNLACTPCYHSREANRVRVDGDHTVAEVEAQMRLARELRGPSQHAQLIGGEVTLLGPEAHAAALEAMIRNGRKPMSMTHGDFDYDYLEALALDPETGRPRFRHLSFAGHFDSTMRGRRGIKRVRGEAELNPERKRFCAMFDRLRREHGIDSYLAHNMTVTPRNLDQIADVIRECRSYGFRMFSFQPAAFVGNPSRWKEEYRSFDDDDVWREVERGAGGRLHSRALQFGDPRCNRTAYGGFQGGRYWSLFDEDDPRELRVRDSFIAGFGGVDLDAPLPLAAARLARVAAREPRLVPRAVGFAGRLVGRMGGPGALLRKRPRAVTFAMHSFMDASVVRPAWEAIERGEAAEEPSVRAAQERLQACMYGMAHPEDGRMVPGCVQHSVLDPRQNARLAELLPLHDRGA